MAKISDGIIKDFIEILKHFITAFFIFAFALILGLFTIYFYFQSDKEISVKKTEGTEFEVKRR